MTATHTAPAAALEVAQLHPDALDIGENVRDSVDLAQTPDFVDSIRENGVLEAISAVRTADGAIVVRDGQRRTLAARETGLTSIPVVIYPDTEGSDKARAVDRIGKQITANRHREGLTAAQHTRGVAQMLEFGASITKVSKTLAMDKKDVKAQAAVGKAKAARAALDSGQLDLAHAAVVAEFEEAGDTEAVEKLLTTRPYNFDHVAERLRGLREEREAYARAAAPFEEKGFTILPHDHISFGEEVPSPSDLVTTDGDELTPDMIDAAPQFWAVFLGLNDAFFDKATDERVDYVPPAAAATLRAHPCKILRLRTRNHMWTSGDARRGPDTDRVVAHFVDRELGIGQRPTEFEHQRAPMRAHDSLPAIAHQPKSTVTVVRNRTCPEMAVTLTRAANNEPLEPLPLPIARGRQ